MYENEDFLYSLKTSRNKMGIKRKINDKDAQPFSISNCLNKKRDKRKKNCYCYKK